MSTLKPAIVLLHGAWHLPSCWDTITPSLELAGYTVRRPHLPSSGADPIVSDISADVAVIRTTVSQVLDRGQNVMLVMHSYSGLPGTEALAGFDEKSRQAAGQLGWITRLVYVNAFLLPEGSRLNPVGSRENMVPAMVADFEKGTLTVDQTMAKEFIWQDVADTQLDELVSGLVPHSLAVYWSVTSFAAWRYIPTTYVRCMHDVPAMMAATQHMISAAKNSQQCMIDKVIERDVGHCPYVTQPKWMIDMLRQEAGEDEIA